MDLTDRTISFVSSWAGAQMIAAIHVSLQSPACVIIKSAPSQSNGRVQRFLPDIECSHVEAHENYLKTH